jgi:NAD(P)-dependent dehydrogenase (short-subunit alcohol dehydrogenase family)
VQRPLATSSAVHLNFGPGFASYSVAKLAIFRLWDSLAFTNPELSIFHIQPGVVDTAMNKEAGGIEAVGFEDHSKWSDGLLSRVYEADFDLVSLPASFNVWLASPEARFLKGKFLWANWDVDELKARAKEVEASTQLSIGLVGWPFEEASWKDTWKSKTISSA